MKRFVGIMLVVLAVAGCAQSAGGPAADSGDKHLLGDTGIKVSGSLETGGTAAMR